MIPARQIITLLLTLQVVTVAYLWTTEPVRDVGAGRFAVILAIDLLSFAIVSYLYTHETWSEAADRRWILAGSIGLLILLVASLYYP